MQRRIRTTAAVAVLLGVAGLLAAPAGAQPWRETRSRSWCPRATPRGRALHVAGLPGHLFGRRAEDGFAHRPFDNVGVQYGLLALEAGDLRSSSSSTSTRTPAG